MDKQEATIIMRELEAASRKVFEAHGLKMSGCRASFDQGEIKVSVKAEATGDNSPKVSDWNRYAASFGLPADALGKRIRVNGTYATITGLAVSRRKYPVCVTTDAGKDMLYTVEGVKRALAFA